MYKIFPNVKKQTRIVDEGDLLLEKAVVYFEKKLNNSLKELKSFLDISIGDLENSNLFYYKNKLLKEEAYTMDISEKGIRIYSGSNSGFYYATKTLKQIIDSKKMPFTLKAMHIEDEPDLKVRGYMLDISRNKVPKLKTIKELIDIMSDLKMNHLELYVEGFSFEYKSFSKFLTENAYITIEEYKKLEKYSRNHYIDFVPNQNGLGHMSEWLAQEELHDLAEKPEGMVVWGCHRDASTLDVEDPRSLELIDKMYEDMLPLTKSKYFNMGFDEPHELGQGKNKELADKIGVNNLYKNYVNKAYPLVKKHNKIPMIWGDVLVRNNASLDNMPEDMIYLDWGYDSYYPFNKNLKKLKEANVQFMAAPGTTTWCGWFGRLYDWIDNINNAVWSVKELDGLGVVLTDWGDFGHFQHWATTFPPLVYTACMCYRCETGTVKTIRDYLNKYIFKDPKGIFADILMDMGSYYQYEPTYRGNGTLVFATSIYILYALKEENVIEHFKNLMRYSIYSKENYICLMDFFKMKRKHVKLSGVSSTIKKEFLHTCDLIEGFMHANYAFSNDCNNKVEMLEKSKKSLTKAKDTLRKIWVIRNKTGRIDRSIEILNKTIKFVDLSIRHFGGKHGEK